LALVLPPGRWRFQRELLEHAGRALDYVAAQAYAAALIAERCLELDAADSFGAFELDPASGLQKVVRNSRCPTPPDEPGLPSNARPGQPAVYPSWAGVTHPSASPGLF
jgi:hypothetical protein